MIKIAAKPFRSYFVRHHLVDLDHIGFPPFHSYRHLMNPFIFYFFITFLFLLGGLFHRTSLILGLTLLMCGIYLYVSAWRLAKSFVMNRQTLKAKYVEGESVDVVIHIKNKGGIPVQGFVIQDNFGPSVRSRVRLVTTESIKAPSHIRMQYTRICDGGMGSHKVGPLEVSISDVLGVFQFLVVEDTESEIEILPKIESLPQISIRGSPMSTLYGHYDVAQRGLSVNFSGIRPYSPGDSLRHVAWKLSARTGNLLVKEFERAVNCEVTLVLDLNPEVHLGVKSQSTWEYARDVTLGILSQQYELNNSVRLISNHFFSEMKIGEDHLHALCLEVSKWDPEVLASDASLMRWGKGGQLLRRSAQLLTRGSTLIYLTPYHRNIFQEAREVLKVMWAEGIEILIVLVDTNSFVAPLVRKLGWAHLAETAACQGIAEEMKGLRAMGFPVYRVVCGEPLAKGFINYG